VNPSWKFVESLVVTLGLERQWLFFGTSSPYGPRQDFKPPAELANALGALNHEASLLTDTRSVKQLQAVLVALTPGQLSGLTELLVADKTLMPELHKNLSEAAALEWSRRLLGGKP